MNSSQSLPDGTAALNHRNKILLMGNPNVGKSIFFTELTGVRAVSSNYAGTTVSFMEGSLTIGEKEYTLIDVPGTYSLKHTSEAEEVAADFMESGARAVICVLDASNLERNLRLALELRRYGIPLVYALNLTDVAERFGININVKLLEQELGAPVIPAVAVKKQGIAELIEKLEYALSEKKENNCALCHGCPSCPSSPSSHYSSQPENGDVWTTAKEINRRVSRKDASHLSLIDKLGENMMKPMPGIPIAILVMALLIGVVVGGGKALEELILLPIVDFVIVPFFRAVFTSFLPEGVFLNILVGEYGIFVISFEWILALIFPYVLMFYVTFSFLEDSGYLPRISVLFDNVMRKLGVQGGSLIHIMMGFGCAVPAIIGSRAATSRKERIVVSTAICFAVPCISQTGALIALLSAYEWWMLPAMAALAFLLFSAAALTAGKLVKGKVDPLLLEIPNLLIPEPKAYARKLAIRMKHFLLEAEAPMLIAIIIAALLKETGLLEAIAVYAQPLVSRWLGLPPEAVAGLILGIIRREMSVAPLLALDLTPLQAFVGGAVSLMYLPCLSVFGILVKEFKLKVAAIIAVTTIALALLTGGLINQAARLFF
ncbi:MAG: ferrous iron transporter B [Oscillospiraceae bacterium]|nr:ferrous iron transporter B [Oscillospiraceae bacterium]